MNSIKDFIFNFKCSTCQEVVQKEGNGSWHSCACRATFAYNPQNLAKKLSFYHMLNVNYGIGIEVLNDDYTVTFELRNKIESSKKIFEFHNHIPNFIINYKDRLYLINKIEEFIAFA